MASILWYDNHHIGIPPSRKGHRRGEFVLLAFKPMSQNLCTSLLLTSHWPELSHVTTPKGGCELCSLIRQPCSHLKALSLQKRIYTVGSKNPVLDTDLNFSNCQIGSLNSVTKIRRNRRKTHFHPVVTLPSFKWVSVRVPSDSLGRRSKAWC